MGQNGHPSKTDTPLFWLSGAAQYELNNETWSTVGGEGNDVPAVLPIDEMYNGGKHCYI